MPYFSAVPLGTPPAPHGIDQPLPSAGPYYLASHIRDSQEVLRRNPNYRGPRPRRLDAIVISNGVEPDATVEQVARGRADYTTLPPGASGVKSDWAAGGPIARRFGAPRPGRPRYVAPPAAAGMRFLLFNTRRGVFRDARLRRAASLALDRRPLAALVSEPATSALLPPGVAGAARAEPYPVGGDIARARALARGRGGRVVLATYLGDRCPWCEHAAALIRQQLARIGIRVGTVLQQDPWDVATRPHTRADLILANWLFDWPDPSNLLGLVAHARPLGYGYGLWTGLTRMSASSVACARRISHKVATGPPHTGGWRQT